MGNRYDGIRGFALNAIKSNPNVRNNPQFAQMIQAIQSGDAQLGQQLAENVLRNYGVTKEEAVMKGLNMFGLNR